MLHEDPPTTETHESPAPDGETDGESESPEEEESDEEA